MRKTLHPLPSRGKARPATSRPATSRPATLRPTLPKAAPAALFALAYIGILAVLIAPEGYFLHEPAALAAEN